MRETDEKKTLAFSWQSPVGSTATLDNRDLNLHVIRLLRSLAATLAAPSPLTSPRRDLDLSLRVPGSRICSFGAKIRLSVGVAVRRIAFNSCLQTPSIRKGLNPMFLTRTLNLPLNGGPPDPRGHTDVSWSGLVGTVPWVPRRPPYAYHVVRDRHPPTKCPWGSSFKLLPGQTSLYPPALATFLRFGAPRHERY